jgi:hypothetical protein
MLELELALIWNLNRRNDWRMPGSWKEADRISRVEHRFEE